MDDSLFVYLQQLELITFFSGYPFIYAVVFFIAGNQQDKNSFKKQVTKLLPSGYALVGILYLGFQLKNHYLVYFIQNSNLTLHQTYWQIWGFLSLLFWIPALAKKIVLSLLHSLVFFFFLARDIILRLSASTVDIHVVRNDMQMYTVSLLLNLGAILVIVLISFFVKQYRR